MAAIRSNGNKDTELKLAGIFRELGVKGWRRHARLAGKPDFVFRGERLAVFVDGCFWHGCPKHGRQPESHQSYWRGKMARNKARDLWATRTLRRAGWRVLRIWEHELSDNVRIARRIRSALAKRVQRKA